MRIESYRKKLPDAAVTVRNTVFVEEQGFVDEYDDIDAIATHLVMFDEENHPMATCRVFPMADSPREEGAYCLGRLAVMKPCRGQHLGADLVSAAENCVRAEGGRCIILHAQCAAAGFYEAQGFVREGEEDEEQDCPHVWMRKIL